MKRNIIIIILLAIICFPLNAQEATIQNKAAVQEEAVDSVNVKQQSNVILHNGTITKAMADSAYIKGDYASAISMYEDILNKGVSDVIYYNLGNSYYKSGNIARAILNYERAYLLNPGDADIRFNLNMARSKTIDKSYDENEFFLVTWLSSIQNILGTDGWARAAIVFFIIFLVMIGLYVIGRKLLVRKIGFIGMIIFLILVIVANTFAFNHRQSQLEQKAAIVMAPSVTVKSTPDVSGTDLFILHEGHKVAIKDATMKAWCEIQLEDGSIGWLPVDVIEVI